MRLLRSGVPLLLGLAAFAAAGGASAEPPPAATGEAPRPPPADREQRAKQAMTLHDEAWALYEQGRYRAAIERLEAALRIDPDGRELVYNLALLHEKLADLPEAETYYRRYVEMEPDPRAKAKAQAVLRRLEGAAKEAAAHPPAPAAPPPPAFRPRLLPRPVRPWVVASGSVAGAALVVGAAFGIHALMRNPGSGASTGGGVTLADLQADAHDAHRWAMAADSAFVVSAVAAGTALVLYFSTPRPLVAAGPRLQVSF
jgi:tetratricopeptide (TPR) repeat protein